MPCFCSLYLVSVSFILSQLHIASLSNPVLATLISVAGSSSWILDIHMGKLDWVPAAYLCPWSLQAFGVGGTSRWSFLFHLLSFFSVLSDPYLFSISFTIIERNILLKGTKDYNNCFCNLKLTKFMIQSKINGHMYNQENAS